jgi:hypothetical protein
MELSVQCFQSIRKCVPHIRSSPLIDGWQHAQGPDAGEISIGRDERIGIDGDRARRLHGVGELEAKGCTQLEPICPICSYCTLCALLSVVEKYIVLFISYAYARQPIILPRLRSRVRASFPAPKLLRSSMTCRGFGVPELGDSANLEFFPMVGDRLSPDDPVIDCQHAGRSSIVGFLVANARPDHPGS